MPDSTGTTGTGSTEGTATGTEATGTGTTTSTATTATEELGDGGKAALAAERKRATALERELREARTKIEAGELAGKTEAEQLRIKLQNAESERDSTRVEALRYRIAAAHGIDADDAATFLTAADEAGMTKQAERLVELHGAKPTPKPDPSQGNQGGDMALNGDPILASLKVKLGIP